MDEKESASAYGTMFSSVSEDLSRLLPGPAVPGFQKVKDMLDIACQKNRYLCTCVIIYVYKSFSHLSEFVLNFSV